MVLFASLAFVAVCVSTEALPKRKSAEELAPDAAIADQKRFDHALFGFTSCYDTSDTELESMETAVAQCLFKGESAPVDAAPDSETLRLCLEAKIPAPRIPEFEPQENVTCFVELYEEAERAEADIGFDEVIEESAGLPGLPDLPDAPPNPFQADQDHIVLVGGNAKLALQCECDEVKEGGEEKDEPAKGDFVLKGGNGDLSLHCRCSLN